VSHVRNLAKEFGGGCRNLQAEVCGCGRTGRRPSHNRLRWRRATCCLPPRLALWVANTALRIGLQWPCAWPSSVMARPGTWKGDWRGFYAGLSTTRTSLQPDLRMTRAESIPTAWMAHLMMKPLCEQQPEDPLLLLSGVWKVSVCRYSVIRKWSTGNSYTSLVPCLSTLHVHLYTTYMYIARPCAQEDHYITSRDLQ